MRKLFVMIAVFLSYCISIYAEPLEQLKILKAGELLYVNFSQEKKINGIPKPIISTGYMILWGGKGILWSVTTPFSSDILISKNGLFTINKGQKLPLIKSNQGRICDLLSKLLMGDFTEINLFYTEDFAPEQGLWKKRLHVGKNELKNFLQSIDIKGNDRILKITLNRNNNDRDEIFFENHIFFQESDIDKFMTPLQKELFD